MTNPTRISRGQAPVLDSTTPRTPGTTESITIVPSRYKLETPRHLELFWLMMV